MRYTLTEAQMARFKSSVLRVADALGLHGWRIDVEPMQNREGVLGQVEYSYSGRTAYVTCNINNFKNEPVTDADVDEVAVHEVLHLLLADLRETVGPYLPKQDESLHGRIESMEHAVVRSLTRVLAPMLGAGGGYDD